MGDDQKRQERIELLRATAELLSGLAPVFEREEPEVLGKRTAIYLSEDVWQSAVKAQERAGAVLNRLRTRDADFAQWARLYSLTVLAQQLTGTADDGDDIRVTHCLYELLEDAAEEAGATMHADAKGPGAEEENGTATDTVSQDAGDVGTTLRRYATDLVRISEVVAELDTPDPGLFDVLRARVAATVRLLGRIEFRTKPGEEAAGWNELTNVSEHIDVLATVLMALDGRTPTIPEEVLPGFAAWRPPAYLARDVGRVLKVWAEKHGAEEVANV